MTTKNIILLGILAIGVLSNACTKKKWAKTAEVSISATATTNDITIASKHFIMDTLMLDIDLIGLSGDRIQADDISLSSSKQIQTNFITTSSLGVLSFDVPQGTYDKMEMSVRLADYAGNTTGSNEGNTVRITGQYFFPNGDIYNVDIALNTDAYQVFTVLDYDNEERVLIEEGNPRSLQLIMNVEDLFDEVTPGQWNSAAVTLVDGNETLIIDESNNQSVYLEILSGFPNSISAKFN